MRGDHFTNYTIPIMWIEKEIEDYRKFQEFLQDMPQDMQVEGLDVKSLLKRLERQERKLVKKLASLRERASREQTAWSHQVDGPDGEAELDIATGGE